MAHDPRSLSTKPTIALQFGNDNANTDKNGNSFDKPLAMVHIHH